MISAVLFDLDGLLADTECLHCQSYQEALGAAGITISEHDYADHWIRAGLGVREWVELHGLSHDPVALRRSKAETYQRLVAASVQCMPGARELVQALHGKIRLAVASSGYRVDVETVLRQLGLIQFFETISTADSVTRLKPHPDIFLHAAAQLGVAPSECVVLEDAEKGVLAARAAGMYVIAAPNSYTHTNDFSQATLVVNSLEEVSLELLLSLDRG